MITWFTGAHRLEPDVSKPALQAGSQAGKVTRTNPLCVSCESHLSLLTVGVVRIGRSNSGSVSSRQVGTLAWEEVLGKDLPYYVAVYVGQSHITTAVSVGEFLMIDADEVQHRGMQVMDVDFVLDGGEAEFVCRAVDHATA